jgi:thiamine-phosphate pyrophosphorylase
MFGTRSHPGWKPLRPMKVAAMIRLANTPVLALGGMNERRFRRIERLGFQGWAGIDAWIRT